MTVEVCRRDENCAAELHYANCPITDRIRRREEARQKMAQHDSSTEQEHSVYEDMAEGIDQIREVCRAGVAGLMTDGFLEVEARAIIAGVFSYNIPKAPEEGSA